MNETQPTQGDNDQVIVALEGDAGNLEKLVTLARECGFRKLLSALVKDLQKAQAEKIEIIAMRQTTNSRLLGAYRVSGLGIAQRVRDRAIPA